MDVKTAVEAIGRLETVPTLLKVVSEMTGLRFAAIAYVTQDSWTACAVHDGLNFGLSAGGELDVTTTLCAEVRDSLRPIVIEHASQDLQYCNHRTPQQYGFESYFAVPIFRRDGSYFGTVCGLDPRPTKLKDEKLLSMLTLFAQLLSHQLEEEEQKTRTEAALREAQQDAELREQFIAVLGHDIRNPLSSMMMGASSMLRPEAAPSPKVLQRILSSGRRIMGLIDDVLDLARGRLGGGIAMTKVPVADLQVTLSHVVAELESTHPERTVRWMAEPLGVVECDRDRVAQVLSNLLANALQHSQRGTPIEVRASNLEGTFSLSVLNQGEPIHESLHARLFQPYFRGPEGQQERTGLGLGLYIVSEVAVGHGGSVGLRSDTSGTLFKVQFPSKSA